MNREILILILLGFFGVLFQNLRKFSSIRRKGNVIDLKITPTYYFTQNWDILMTQVIVVFIMLFLFKEFVGLNPKIAGLQRTLFLLAGGCGSEITSFFMDTMEKEVMEKIKNFDPTKKN